MSEATPFTFRAFERSVRVDCAENSLASLLDANFGAMGVPDSEERPALRYRLTRSGAGFVLRRDRSRTWRTRQTSDLLFFLEKDVTIELQKLRRDLYFVHAAALEPPASESRRRRSPCFTTAFAISATSSLPSTRRSACTTTRMPCA